ncbi:uncharacterized protein N7525_004839 [Penicillium rubens]|uniref:Uncharacterized protein n=1 Tax=Penicillium chrysogenum TaxID=5076 RepID=A0ABQ8WTF7_PENCH|nr:uncharacterized protein N7525_004839 [Penicillium rubens]KAJ5282249.1 hypothetical protein N7505_000229 [Penicillium chrysogenum]KAJ5839651.1 hypothetical protein N7525_004839 [Penicillium rubens]KAJ5867646.1 hypothetical protein N7534_002199 [Penicillium rubens]KAJ6141170.1 hypothetical protein N7497_012063 [Penicillium chrysogenum]
MDHLRDRLYSHPVWGHVVRRTTYSAESDAVFPGTVRYIDGRIRQSFSKTPTRILNSMIPMKCGPNIVNYHRRSNATQESGPRAWVDEESLQTLKRISAEYLANQGPGYSCLL